ncbi:MAG: DUF3256 family protein [Coprobacter sp.]|nr:DUF3256 family protein [Coprobacter sp.]
MKRHIITLLLALFCCIGQADNRSIGTWFVAMPDSLLPLLSVNDRKDLLDLHNAGRQSGISGHWGENVSIESIGDDQLTLKLTPSSSLQIATLRTADTIRVIAVIHTVKLPAADSRICFYDTNWNRLTNPVFSTPQVRDFITGNKKVQSSIAHLIGEIFPCRYEIRNGYLYATQSLQDFLPRETYSEIKESLKSEIPYKWNGKSFKK